jgi:hypothetical protein
MLGIVGGLIRPTGPKVTFTGIPQNILVLFPHWQILLTEHAVLVFFTPSCIKGKAAILTYAINGRHFGDM